MSADRIDVLAQLRTTYCPPECLAAVAALIEKAGSINTYLPAACTGMGDGYKRDVADFRAALARVGGDV